MSKSKKNTIDPENIIWNYGADATRLFILSDSPPEKDIQWSDEGIISSFKFIQKLWNLNLKINDEIKKNHKKDTDNEITKYTNKFIERMTKNLNDFGYNKLIANLHEMHSYLSKQINYEYKNTTLKENYEKILTTMSPIIPHFTNECLEMINSKKLSWPKYDLFMLEEEEVNIVIQVNGKKRGLIKSKKNTTEKDILSMIENDEKIIKYINKIPIKKKIYIKDKLLNIIL